MSLLQWANNPSTTFASGISSTSTSCTVAAGTGQYFPALSGGQYFYATLISASGTAAQGEIVKVTGHSSDTFTIVRGQDGTTAQSFEAGDTFALLIPRIALQYLVQTDDLQAQATNYALDTGSANAYVAALTPALTAYVIGAPIRVKIAHSNTGQSTLNVGPGAQAITYPGGASLVGGEILAGGIYTFYWTGSVLELANPSVGTAGSFTATCPDLSGSPTVTVYYAKSGPLVTLYSTGVGGTSVTTDLTLTGLPAALTPVRNQSFSTPLIEATDDGDGCWATMVVGQSGVITFGKLVPGTNTLIEWTASGNKEMPNFNVTYSLL